MDLTQLLQYARACLWELWVFKIPALLLFAFCGFGVLVAGMFWPVTFESSATIYADNQNILKPLLDKQAAVAKLQDQTQVVRDVMMSPRILRLVVEDVYPDMKLASDQEMEKAIGKIRGNLTLKGLGSTYIKVSYKAGTPDETYETLNSLVDIFIRDSADTQRNESREAFTFIDSQVKQYKQQLLDSEQKLKKFKSDEFEGGASAVESRIANLRNTIEEMHISMDEVQTRINSLQKQLSEENKYSAQRFKEDVYTERLASLNERLNQLMLVYKPSHPDVVSVKLQIEETTRLMNEVSDEKALQTDQNSEQQSDVTVNPLYAELRSKLAEAKVNKLTLERRLEAHQGLLEEAFKRRKLVAEGQAELAELTRDYNVTRKIYEDMLERKERARLSMALNVEGQGIAYRVQEPPVYPLNPTGFSFIHFVMLGPVVGVLVPIGLVIVYVLLDPRLRFPAELEQAVGVPVVGVVPHINTQFSRLVSRADIIIVVLLFVVILAAYLGVAYARKMGAF